MGYSHLNLSGSHVPVSRPDRWLVPHQSLDPSVRRMTYGPIKPMDWSDRSFFSRLFRWN